MNSSSATAREARDAAALGEILIVVDVLSFSTGVSYALERGVRVFPCAPGEGEGLARELGAALAVHRGQDGPSLSPPSLAQLAPGTRLVLPSPNGSACSRLGAASPALLLGALVNARAAAAAAQALHEASGAPICVLACGERWKEDLPGISPLRFALEDALGAGAILAALEVTRSPEAEVCALAFSAARARLGALLETCGSGRELIEGGFAEDVAAAAALDALSCVPLLREGEFVQTGASS